MSALNLVPNAGLIATHAGIFLANLYVVKKLMIDPYVKLRDQRFAQTKGGQEDAEKMLRACEEKAAAIEKRIGEAYDFTKSLRGESKDKALDQQQSMITVAKKDAKVTLERLKQEINTAIQQEKQQVPEVVRHLSEQVYAAVVH